MIENLNYVYINKNPSSAKIKPNKLPNNTTFYKSKIIPHPKSQSKRRTCKEKLDEENNKSKKSISLNHSNNKIINEKEKKPLIYNHINKKIKIGDNQIIPHSNNFIQLEENIIKELYNETNYNNEKKNIFFIKSRNQNTEQNSNIKILYSEQSKSCKDKKIIPVKNRNENIFFSNETRKNLKSKNPFINYKNNYINIWRNNDRKKNENISEEVKYNNIFHNINNKNEYFSFFTPNEASTVNETQNNNNQTTSKINGKTKKIYTNDYFKENEMENINECISLEKINTKLHKNIFNKTVNNFHYMKPKINDENLKPEKNNNEKRHIVSKSNNKATRVKNVFIKNRAPHKILNDNLNLENIDNNINHIDNENNTNKKNINANMHHMTNIQNDKEFHKINIDNFNKVKKNNRINSSDTKFKIKSYFENEIIRNITYDNLFTPKNENPNNLTEFNHKNNFNSFQNIIFNDNKNIFIQNNYINEKLNSSFNKIKKKNSTNNSHIKNFSYNLGDNRNRNSKNNIKNIKNSTILRKNGITPNDKIKTYNIKDILLDNSKVKNDVPLLKQSQKKNNETITEKNNENDDTTFFEESIIFNDSDVYGTLTLKNSINNNKEKNLKEDNKDKNNNINIKNIKNNININNTYNNSNFRETITINYADKSNNEVLNNKIKIEDLLKDKNFLQKKINENINNMNKNNNILYFKNYYSMTNAGKNYGVRKTNQDMPVTIINLNGVKGFNIFGVLDGHGVNGHHVSKFLSEYLVKQIINNKEISNLKELDKIYHNLTKSNYELLINIFLNSDIILGKQNFDVNFSGTTCVLIIQVGKKIICTNVGDSRAILVYDKKKDDSNLQYSEIFELSHDFKPDLPDEKERIIRMGGTIDQMLDINGNRCGPQRVWVKNKNFPGLAMSRSLGDFKGKQCGIIPLPEIIEYKLDEKSKYMVICSDGVWEFLSNKNVMDIGNEFYLKNDIIGFTKKLVQISEELWEKKDVIVDDITAVVVFF